MVRDLRQRQPHPGVQLGHQRSHVRAELRAGRAQRIRGLQPVAARVVETLDLGLQDANRLKFTPDGRVLIIDGEAASLVVMDAASRTVIKRVSLGSTDTGDGAVLVAPDGSRAYLGLRAADRVAVMDWHNVADNARAGVPVVTAGLEPCAHVRPLPPGLVGVAHANVRSQAPDVVQRAGERLAGLGGDVRKVGPRRAPQWRSPRRRPPT